ncbi:hypothetical protein [Jannaschia sp. R86511]|uniref:hypothetical protein n=1 Tax=Jannaschia sp. R86511 TaxID=3093853 RepID=UPI0036D24380
MTGGRASLLLTPGTAARRSTGSALVAVLVVVGLTCLVVVLRLPLLGAPLSPDEGGFLLLGSQWGPGRSLYGDYWVDRPPLLIGFFALADRLGGAVALRSLGLVAVAAAVLGAAAVGALASPGASRARVAGLCALTAAVFVSTPLFGGAEVDGEVVAMPLVLAGVALLLLALRRAPGPARTTALLGAGGIGAAAVLVKQNEWDVFVVLGVLLVSTWRRSGRDRMRARDLLVALVGAAAVGALVVGVAATLGTGPAALWDAVVTFRLDASRVIGRSASPAVPHRLRLLLLALVVSGAPLVIALLVRHLRRPVVDGAIDVRAPAAALLLWELFVVLAGGSYWLHYLLVLVPGLVLSVAVLEVGRRTPGSGRRVTAVPVLAWGAVACVVALGWTLGHPGPAREAAPVVAWLGSHTEAGDDAVIAYGQPDILQAAGLASPYPDIWSLPVRVHDPRLHALAALLAGDRAPDWVVVPGGDLETWGVDATAGTAALDARYVRVADVDGYAIYQRDPTVSTR